MRLMGLQARQRHHENLNVFGRQDYSVSFRSETKALSIP